MGCQHCSGSQGVPSVIVADANVLLYLVCDTPQTELARRVYAADADWAVPILWEPEVLNGLLVMHRAGLLELEDATTAWRNAAMATAGCVHDCNAGSVLDTAAQTGLSVYDAYYVTLARMLNVPLVTEDKKVRRACSDIARSMRDHVVA